MAAAPANSCVVSPSRLAFDPTGPNSKQVVTVYNLRSEPINFRVQCDAPTMFKIKPPRGLLPPQTLLELIVRVSAVDDQQQVPLHAKMRVQFINEQDAIVSALTIKLDVRANNALTLASSAAAGVTPPSSGSRSKASPPRADPASRSDSALLEVAQPARSTTRFSLLSGGLLAAAAFVLYLFMVDEDGVVVGFLWNKIALSPQQQFILAFVLGMLAMALVREF